MYSKRRELYLNLVNEKSISILFSGTAPQKSADQSYKFEVNRNFYYLTGIDQADTVLLMVKGAIKTDSYLFIEKTDPIKALWDGEGFSFEDASKVSGIALSNIKERHTLEIFLNQLLETSRRAIFGQIEAIYLDLERQSLTHLPTKGIMFAEYIQKQYPQISIKANQQILANQRMIKDDSEIKLTLEAIDITNKALNHVMCSMKPGMYEYEIEAEYNYILNKHHLSPSFTTIAGSGKNGTILHYEKNHSKTEDGDLILLDLGVKHQIYCSDISRTYPVNGKFTKRQREIYEIVLESNKKTIEWLKAGVTIQEFNEYGKKILVDGLKRIGLIKEDHEITKYYYHSLGHYLGLDVHDVGDYTRVIPENAIITVEPGLYIAEENIGIRIEDNILVTKDGSINLSKDIIKEVEDIENFFKMNK